MIKPEFFTNLAFEDDFYRDGLKYFNNSRDLYFLILDTYTGLSLYCFSEYKKCTHLHQPRYLEFYRIKNMNMTFMDSIRFLSFFC